jgi:hypothetical protein
MRFPKTCTAAATCSFISAITTLMLVRVWFLIGSLEFGAWDLEFNREADPLHCVRAHLVRFKYW